MRRSRGEVSWLRPNAAAIGLVEDYSIQSGQVHLNYPAWDPQAPFGGYKQSGNGREYGIEGMEEYMEVKSILGYYA